ncbi:MAG: M56 family metallopeptidase [Bacteroidia bacterium]|nr:M56 family metallopeptidase [Bacteroidia bacterium]
MLSYVLASGLLSCAGWLGYRLLARRSAPAPQARKGLLYAVLATSLLLPLLTAERQASVRAHPMGWGSAAEHAAVQQFCRCERPNEAHRVRYRANALYEWLLAYKGIVQAVIGLIAAAVLLQWALQVRYLRRLVRSSRQELLQVQGQALTLLIPAQPHSAGAFWLGRSYIIWQEELARLSPEEREAVWLHELSHLRQHSTLEKTLLRAVQSFWFWNPALYAIRRELDLLGECIADEAGAAALPSRRTYAALLLRMREWQLAPLTAPLRGSSLTLRVHQLLSPPEAARRRFPAAGLLLIWLCQAALCVPVYASLDRQVHNFNAWDQALHRNPESGPLYCTDCETVCLPE